MKIHFITLLLGISFLGFPVTLNAQKAKARTAASSAYPASFTIGKADFDRLFEIKAKESISSKNNKYLDKGLMMMNSLNGDMKFLKIQLSYFKNAYLLVQVNGEWSTQIFILSDDKSVFYKGKIDKGSVTMSKCQEDDIVSE